MARASISCELSQCRNALDFDIEMRPGLDCHAASCRKYSREILAIHSIHVRGKVIICDENQRFEDVIERRAGMFQSKGQCLHTCTRLRRYVTLDDLTCLQIDRWHTAGVKQIINS